MCRFIYNPLNLDIPTFLFYEPKRQYSHIWGTYFPVLRDTLVFRHGVVRMQPFWCPVLDIPNRSAKVPSRETLHQVMLILESNTKVFCMKNKDHLSLG